MTPKDPIIAIGLLTQHDLELLGAGFNRAFPIDDSPCFTDLLAAIDAAEREREEAGIIISGQSIPS